MVDLLYEFFFSGYDMPDTCSQLDLISSAGMELHELLDIPQGDRRKYHDDVTVMVISLEGRIWKSSGKYLEFLQLVASVQQ